MDLDKDNNFLKKSIENPYSIGRQWMYDDFKEKITYEIHITNWIEGKKIFPKGKTRGGYFVFKGHVKPKSQKQWITCTEIHFAINNLINSFTYCQNKNIGPIGDILIEYVRENRKKAIMISITSILEF